MTIHTQSNVQHPVTQDQPLPGFYPCLTLQLNITRYASGGLGRFVCVVREPSDNLEIGRWFGDTDEFPSIAQRATDAFAQAVTNMVYLQDARND